MRRFALVVTTALALVAGCAQGVVDDAEEPLADPALQIELWDAEALGVETVTASAFEARSITGETPAPRPEILDESETCDTIVGSYHAHGLELGCATTTHVCPDMLRFAFGQACLQFEGATVDNCVQRIRNARTCEELWTMSCDVVPVPDSAPAGCPEELE